MRDVEERAEAVLAQLPTYVWDRDTLPVPVEDIADTQFGLLVRDVEDMAARPGHRSWSIGRALRAPAARARRDLGQRARGQAVAAAAAIHDRARARPLGDAPRRGPAGAVLPRVNEAEAKARDIEEEASAFAAALLMPQWLFVREHARAKGDVATLCRTFGSSIAATQRRIASLF